jgi:hypothetical protein
LSVTRYEADTRKVRRIGKSLDVDPEIKERFIIQGEGLAYDKANVELMLKNKVKEAHIGKSEPRIKTEFEPMMVYSGVVDLVTKGTKETSSMFSVSWECGMQGCYVEADFPVKGEAIGEKIRDVKDVEIEGGLPVGCVVSEIHPHELVPESHVHVVCAVYPTELEKTLSMLIDISSMEKIKPAKGAVREAR